MSELVDMLWLCAIVTFIVDVSGWTDTWKGWLGRWLTVTVGRVRPFDCSLCMTWWACVVLLLCRGAFSLENIAIAAVVAALSKVVAELYSLARYAAETALGLINRLLDKLWQSK